MIQILRQLYSSQISSPKHYDFCSGSFSNFIVRSGTITFFFLGHGLIICKIKVRESLRTGLDQYSIIHEFVLNKHFSGQKSRAVWFATALHLDKVLFALPERSCNPDWLLKILLTNHLLGVIHLSEDGYLIDLKLKIFLCFPRQKWETKKQYYNISSYLLLN